MTYAIVVGVAVIVLVVGVLCISGVVALGAWAMLRGKSTSPTFVSSVELSPQDIRREEIKATVSRDFDSKWASKKSAELLAEFQKVMV